MEIVRSVRRLSLLPPTTTEKLQKDTDDWAEVLYGVIPLSDLRPIYIEAYREHKPGSIFEAAELLQAWYRRRAGLAPAGLMYSEKCPLCRSHNEGQNERPCPFHQMKDRPTCHRCGVPHDALPIENKDFFNRCDACQRYTIPKEGAIESKFLKRPGLLQIVQENRCTYVNDHKVPELRLQCILPKEHEGRCRFSSFPVSEVAIRDAGPPGTYVEDKLKETIESPKNRCIATTEIVTEPDRTFRCELHQGHEGEHRYTFKNDEPIILQPANLVVRGEGNPCIECGVPNDGKFYKEDFFQANEGLFVKCPVCCRLTKPAPTQKSED